LIAAEKVELATKNAEEAFYYLLIAADMRSPSASPFSFASRVLSTIS